MILPKIIFNFEITSSEEYQIKIIISTTNIDSIYVHFHNKDSINAPITVQFDKLDNIENANKIQINFGNNEQNTIDMKGYVQSDYLEFIGNDINIINKNNNDPKTSEPIIEPKPDPTAKPTPEPTVKPTLEPTTKPTLEPTTKPTPESTLTVSYSETNYPSEDLTTSICYYQNRICTLGTAFKDFTTLNTIVPAETKNIILYIKKATPKIDLTTLQTTDATMNIRYDNGGVFQIYSIQMGEEEPNQHVSHLILEKLELGGSNDGYGNYDITSSEVTFDKCLIYENATPTITISDKSKVNIDDFSYQNIFCCKKILILNFFSK